MASFASRALLSKGLSPIPGAQRLASHVTRRTMAAGEYADTNTNTDRRKTDLKRGPLQSLLFLLPRRRGRRGSRVRWSGPRSVVLEASSLGMSRMAAARHRERHRAPRWPPSIRIFFFFWQTLTPASCWSFFFFPSCVAVAEPGAPAKVNCWEAPTDIPSWKEEHIVIAVLTGWAVVIYGAKKAFGGGGKKEEAK